MKVMVCGSLSYAARMSKVKHELAKLGHEALATKDLDMFVADPELCDDLDTDFKYCVVNNILRQCMDLVTDSDALLVLNYPKNGIDGYIGTAVIQEMAVGYYLHKQLYILNPLPDYHEHRWVHEVAMMRPICIHGDLAEFPKAETVTV